MRLRLNICGVDVQLKITGWHKTETAKTMEEWKDYWCQVELSLHSDYLNYNLDGELLMSEEVDSLERVLGELLDGKLEEDCTVEFAEPDLQFDLHVAKRKPLYDNKSMDLDIDADFVIQFWDADGLGSNTFRMYMNRAEMEAFYTYLSYVTGKIAPDDEGIVSFIEKGMILPE